MFLVVMQKLLQSILPVIKASLISNDSVQAGEPYMFPSANDDLSEFTGGSTQFTFPNAALKDVLEKLPEGKCLCYILGCNNRCVYSASYGITFYIQILTFSYRHMFSC